MRRVEERKQVRWHDIHTLSAEIGALEVRAGIFEELAQARYRNSYLIQYCSPNSSREMLDDESNPLVRFVARQLYFGVEDEPLRMELIRKQCEYEQAYQSVYDDAIENARKDLVDSENQELPGTRVGVCAAASVTVGAAVFQIYGAIAGALFAYFVGQGMMDSARRDRENSVRAARARLDAQIEEKKREYRPTRPWFSHTEQRSGRRNGSDNPQADIDLATQRKAAYGSLRQREGDFEIFELQARARFGWAALLSPDQIGNFGINDNYEPISNEQYLEGIAKMRSDAQAFVEE